MSDEELNTNVNGWVSDWAAASFGKSIKSTVKLCHNMLSAFIEMVINNSRVMHLCFQRNMFYIQSYFLFL